MARVLPVLLLALVGMCVRGQNTFHMFSGKGCVDEVAQMDDQACLVADVFWADTQFKSLSFSATGVLQGCGDDDCGGGCTDTNVIVHNDLCTPQHPGTLVDGHAAAALAWSWLADGSVALHVYSDTACSTEPVRTLPMPAHQGDSCVRVPLQTSDGSKFSGTRVRGPFQLVPWLDDACTGKHGGAYFSARECTSMWQMSVNGKPVACARGVHE